MAKIIFLGTDLWQDLLNVICKAGMTI